MSPTKTLQTTFWCRRIQQRFQFVGLWLNFVKTTQNTHQKQHPQQKTHISDEKSANTKVRITKMLQFLYFTQLTAFLATFLAIAIALITYDHFRSKKEQKDDGDDLPQPPSPRGYPIIGHLHLLGGYEVPYQAFTDLGKKYGSVIKLKLGSYNCVIVNDQKNIREALVTKGHHFDSRPNFERYQQLFCGNRENCKYFFVGIL